MKYLTIIVASLMMTVSAQAYDKQELEFMKEFFNTIQQRTFDNNREYCGYLMIDSEGYYVTSKPKKGQQDACMANEPPIGFDILASYHTHGAFSIDADSELPSSTDLQADVAEQVDGWIATPGGRIWFNDSLTGISEMACGRDCIMSDPKFDADMLEPVKNTYTVETISQRDELFQ